MFIEIICLDEKITLSRIEGEYSSEIGEKICKNS